MRSFEALGVAACLTVSLACCTWQTGLPSDAASIPVDRDRELVVTDDAVLASLSNDASDAPLSFRHAMERVFSSQPAGEATLAWMAAWSQRLRDEGMPERADALDATVTCPWLRRNPDNRCDASCDSCASRVLRLEDAPLRLVAVANRTDLSVMPDRSADGGEGRLIFALTDGAADSRGAPALPVTVALEYGQQGSAKDWASRWHALGALPDAAFPGALAALVGTFVDAGAIAQVRTGDAATGPLVLHEFHLETGALVAARVRDTPDWNVVSEDDIRTFCSANGDAIENGTFVLPEPWLAASAPIDAQPPSYLTGIPHHDAFLGGTCAGCHSKADRGFQIDPLATGAARLSRFLVDPTADTDEIRRRVEWMQLTLAQ